MGKHLNRLDAKGRVSVPAQYRASLRPTAEDASSTIVLRRSHKYPCIEAWPLAGFLALASPLSQLNQFSDAHDDMSASVYADAYEVEADKEGRIMLPDELVEHASLAGQVLFVGMGGTFHLWEPAAGARRLDEARSGARRRDQGLPANPA